jgi:hypothetical protein
VTPPANNFLQPHLLCCTAKNRLRPFLGIRAAIKATGKQCFLVLFFARTPYNGEYCRLAKIGGNNSNGERTLAKKRGAAKQPPLRG